MGTGENEKGLCFLPDGKEYYEILVKQSTGTDRTVRELEDLTRRQITEDLEAMEAVVGTTAEDAKETMAKSGQEDAEIILGKLEEGIRNAFPESPETEFKIKYVPSEMEEHLSPAFYMIPAIDNTGENVIYLNQSKMGDDLTLFTTLAHEGYPGHLYQTVYYEGTDPDPVRSLFSFGGYVEGWATYAEMCSYYLTPLSKEQAVLLQKNSSIILALYALADMGIHYEGWSRLDTVAFFSSYGITDAETVEQIYELIIGSPANYLKYYIGYVEFLELRKSGSGNRRKLHRKNFMTQSLQQGRRRLRSWKNICGIFWKRRKSEEENDMLNYLWAGMILTGIIFGAFNGKMPEITNAALDSAKDAVTLCITMIGVMAFWTGIMEIASRAGIIESASGKMRPLIRFLFPEIPEEHKANEHITTNFIANFLGLGWAATPAGD